MQSKIFCETIGNISQITFVVMEIINKAISLLRKRKTPTGAELMHWNFLYPEENSGGSGRCRSQQGKIITLRGREKRNLKRRMSTEHAKKAIKG
jgi:hypothetical protein